MMEQKLDKCAALLVPAILQMLRHMGCRETAQSSALKFGLAVVYVHQPQIRMVLASWHPFGEYIYLKSELHQPMTSSDLQMEWLSSCTKAA